MTGFSTFLLTLFYCSRSHSDHRIAEFSRIKSYELVYVDVSKFETTQTISFTAFGQQYDIELSENEKMAPSTVRHTNGLPTDIGIDHEYFTSPTTKSCHYFGKVVTDNTGALQRVSLSLCPRRGIRGEVHAFNETIVIKPAKYFLDTAYDSAHPHHTTDEHLVYRMSDYDLDEEPEPEGDFDSDANDALIDTDMMSDLMDMSGYPAHNAELADDENTRRRRTLYNGGTNEAEMLYIIDPPYRAYYVRTYQGTSKDWYTELYQDMADRVNAVSSRYQASDFQSVDIGNVYIDMVELEVIEKWTGKYAGLEPTCKNYPSCMTDTSHASYPCECQVYAYDYLGKHKAFVRDYKDKSTFDASQLISRHSFAGVFGLGYITKMCRVSGWVTSIVAAGPARNENDVRQNMAHELGHNFGANDNRDGNTCWGGIMGGGGQTFTSCALDRIKSKFVEQNGCSCLGTGVRSFTSNVDSNSESCPYSYGSVCLSGVRSKVGGSWRYFNGAWQFDGCHNGASKHIKWVNNVKYYMFRLVGNNGVGKYRIHTSTSSGKTLQCTADSNNVLNCNNRWKYYDGSSWLTDSSSSTYDCGSGAALNVEDTPCDNFDLYNEAMCVQNAAGVELTAEHNVSKWTRMEGVCENEMPVYQYEVDDGNITYYLHFEESQKYSDSDELYPKWQLSVDDGVHGSGYAYCEQRDLLNCTNGKWYAMLQQNGTDYAEFTVQQFMTMLSDHEECAELEDATTEDGANWMDSTTATLAFLLLLLLFLLLLAGVGYCIYRKFMKKDQAMKTVKHMVPDEEEMVKANEEEQEIEVDVETTNMQTR